MSTFYQSLLGITLAVLALGIGVVGAVYQLLVTQVSTAAARLIFRSPLLWAGLSCLIVAAVLTTAGAILLSARHDFVSANLGTDRVLGSALTGVACVALLGLGGFLLVWAGVRAISLLDRMSAARRLARFTRWATVARWAIAHHQDGELSDHDAEVAREGLDIDEMSAAIVMRQVDAASEATRPTSSDNTAQQLIDRLWEVKVRRRAELATLKTQVDHGRLSDPIAPFIELLDGAARAGLPHQVETIARECLVQTRSESPDVATVHSRDQVRLVAGLVFDQHLLPLARRLADRGDFEAVGGLIRAAGDADVDLSSEWYFSAQGFTQKAAPLLLRRQSAGPLCAALRTLARFAMQTAGQSGAQGLFDNACLAIGSLGERIPATFYFPTDPDVVLTPRDLDEEQSDPLGCLIDALDEIKQTVLRGSTDLDGLAWRDAVLLSAKAIEHRAGIVFGDRRLETPLVRTMLLLADLGRQGARDGDERRAMYSAFALGDLAEDAGRTFYHEYPRDIADALAEIGLFSSLHDLKAPDGSSLTDEIADMLVERLQPYLGASMREVLVRGRYSPASTEDRLGFIKRVARQAGDNFGFRFDPQSGESYGPEA